MKTSHLLKRLAFLSLGFLTIEFLWRCLFLFLFGGAAQLSEFKNDLVKAFILGFRFDLTLLCYLHSIPLLWVLLEGTVTKNISSITWRIFKAWYFILFATVTLFNLGDLGFYSFYQDRINILVFGFFEDDTVALIKTMWKNYPVFWMILVLATLAVSAWKALSKVLPDAPMQLRSSRLKIAAITFAIFLVNGIGARGSLGLFPLSEIDLGISKNPFINQLAFNSSRAFARALELKLKTHSEWNSNLKYFKYNDNPRQAFADYFEVSIDQVPQDPSLLLKQKTPATPTPIHSSPHVVLVLMESWGAYWMQFQSPDFDLVGRFAKYQKSELYTDKALSQTAATIGTLSAMMAGLPHRYIGEFLSESEYLQVPFKTSPARNFKTAGYETRFIYGGNPGWREVNKFAKFQGYDFIDGEHEIEAGISAQIEKHDWGIYDHDLWKYVNQILSNAKKPQFLVVMTTSNHPPFQTPSKYSKPLFRVPDFVKAKYVGDKSIPEKRFATYRYAMDSFADFLSELDQSSLHNKTIIAATGDHAFWLINFNEKEQLQKNAVPVFFKLPPELKTDKKMPEFVTQIDILKTLYDLALPATQVWSLGENIFDKNYVPHSYGSSPLIVTSDGGANPVTQSYYDWTQDKSHLVPGQETKTKAQFSLKYKSMMALLDYYMRQEKENARSRR